MKTNEYQPRYVAYAKSNGMTPDAMLAHDKIEYPGGRMCGFMCWISSRLRDFKKAHPQHVIGDNISNHDAFTAFLEAV